MYLIIKGGEGIVGVRKRIRENCYLSRENEYLGRYVVVYSIENVGSLF